MSGNLRDYRRYPRYPIYPVNRAGRRRHHPAARKRPAPRSVRPGLGARLGRLLRRIFGRAR
ncbi:MAG TPA: hypothetical protein VE990_13215 [Acidimicrobiales bacterium]|nr:hypothetical protein [Acidimicrobiales bacterium]